MYTADDLEAIGRQYPFEPFRWLPSTSSHVLRLNFEEAIAILQENGFSEVRRTQDLSFPVTTGGTHALDIIETSRAPHVAAVCLGKAVAAACTPQDGQPLHLRKPLRLQI